MEVKLWEKHQQSAWQRWDHLLMSNAQRMFWKKKIPVFYVCKLTWELTFSIWSSFSLSKAVESPTKEFDPALFNSFSSLATSFCSFFTNVLSDITRLTCALVVTSLAQLANKRVFLDCSTWRRAGLNVQMMAVLALPPKEFCSMRVNLESL